MFRVSRRLFVTAALAVAVSACGGTKTTTTSPSTNDTKGSLVWFNRRAFKVGWRRRVKTETERLPATDQTRIVSTLRMGFGRSEEHTV